MSTFAIPEPISLDRRNYADEYQALLIGDGGADGGVTAVNHGEFEAAVQQLRQQAGREDDSCAVIQRGRRGGKTFMLHAVAAQLAAQQLPQQTHIVFLSLSSGSTQYDPTSEDAFTALASRVAWEMSGRAMGWRRFKRTYRDFGAIATWMLSPNISMILLVDELNVILPKAARYDDMCALLDAFCGQRGKVLLYSTHQRETADHLRGRRPKDSNWTRSTKRPHVFLAIPRMQSPACRACCNTGPRILRSGAPWYAVAFLLWCCKQA
jgi:hypothetical protein